MRSRLGAAVVGLVITLGALAAPSFAAGPVAVGLTRFTGNVSALDQLPVITTGDSPGSEVQLSVTLPQQASSFTWSLVDAGGSTAVGPLALTPVESAPGRSKIDYWLSVQPDAAGQALPDGAYSLIVAATGADGTDYRGTLPLVLAADPPAVHSPAVTARDNAIYDTSTQKAGWEVPVAGIDYDAPATLSIRTAGGKPIAINNPVGSVQADRLTTWYDSGVPTAYSVQWDAEDASGDPVAPGVYSATLTIPDSYGRPIEVPLGKVDVYGVAEADRAVKRQVAQTVGKRPVLRRLQLPAWPLTKATGATVSVKLHLPPTAEQAFTTYRLQVRIDGVTRWQTVRGQVQNAWEDVQLPWPSQTAASTLSHRTVEIRIKATGRNSFMLRGIRATGYGWAWSLT